MFPYGKTASNGVAAMSFLAERYGEEGLKVSSLAIANDRQISKPLVAKVLTILSQAGFVGGSPGPGGGYYLAKAPSEIKLIDIVKLFEKVEDDTRCPFGTHWCGNGDPCPLHDEIIAMSETTMRFLKETSLEVFCEDA